MIGRYPVVSDGVRRTPSIYTKTVHVKKRSNESKILESLDATPSRPHPEIDHAYMEFLGLCRHIFFLYRELF